MEPERSDRGMTGTPSGAAPALSVANPDLGGDGPTADDGRPDHDLHPTVSVSVSRRPRRRRIRTERLVALSSV
jgi:hypothetical protein